MNRSRLRKFIETIKNFVMYVVHYENRPRNFTENLNALRRLFRDMYISG